MAFINVEGWLISLLADRTGEVVGSGPPTAGSRFLVVRRTGGPATLRVFDRPIVVVEGYAPFEDDAIALLNEARTHLLSLRGIEQSVNVYRVSEVGGPGNLPDPLRPKLARYTATYELHLIGLQAA